MENTETAVGAFNDFLSLIHGGKKPDYFRRRDEVVQLFLRLSPEYEFARDSLLVGNEKFPVVRSDWNRLYRESD